jgi:hypothetical protein
MLVSPIIFPMVSLSLMVIFQLMTHGQNAHPMRTGYWLLGDVWEAQLERLFRGP